MRLAADDVGELLFEKVSAKATGSRCRWLLGERGSELVDLGAREGVVAECVETSHDVIGYHLTMF